jgi:hypothetical protein
VSLGSCNPVPAADVPVLPVAPRSMAKRYVADISLRRFAIISGLTE